MVILPTGNEGAVKMLTFVGLRHLGWVVGLGIAQQAGICPAFPGHCLPQVEEPSRVPQQSLKGIKTDPV